MVSMPTNSPAGLARLLSHLRRTVKAEGTRTFAKRAAVSPAFVSQVVNGNVQPSDKLCRAVGWTKDTVYRPLDNNGAGY